MKILVISLVILLAIIGFGTFSFFYLDNTSSRLLSAVQSIEENVMKEKWSEAGNSYDNLESSWIKTSAKWAMIIDHQELDQINITMSRLKRLMDTKDISGSMGELAELKLLIEHIPQKEAVSLVNIF